MFLVLSVGMIHSLLVVLFDAVDSFTPFGTIDSCGSVNSSGALGSSGSLDSHGPIALDDSFHAFGAVRFA